MTPMSLTLVTLTNVSLSLAADVASPPAPAWLPVAILCAFLVIFPIFWMAVCRLLAVFGWSSLADRYRFDGTFPQGGEYFGATSLSIAGRLRWLPVNYNGVVVITIQPDALYIRVWRLFAFGHPPIKLPWAAIEGIDTTTILFMKMHVLTIRGCDKTLLLRGKLATSIVSAWQRYRR